MSTITTPTYAFLSQPPPQVQKKHLQRHLTSSHPAPSLPLPPTPISSSTTPSKEEFSIASWAAAVQPGSPGTPSPRRSSSTSLALETPRRPSLIRRRSASRGIAHIRVPSNATSFVHLIDTPSTGSLNTPKTADLRALGYTNIFVNLPPATPKSAGYALGTTKHNQPAVPVTLTKKKTLSRLRSLSALRPSRSKTTTTAPLPSPTSPMRFLPSSPKHPRSPTKHGRSRSRSKTGSSSPTKSSTSAHRRMHQSQSHSNSKSPSKSKSKSKAPPSPTGAMMQDALLAQFLGGGKLDKQAQRLVPKGDAVWRDGKGGLWRDEDEKVEGLPLLDSSSDKEIGAAPASPGWVKFQGGESPSFGAMDLGDDAKTGRRGSAGSVCTAEMMSREPMAVRVEGEVPRIMWLNASSASTASLASLTTAATASSSTALTASSTAATTSPSTSMPTSTPEVSITHSGADRTMRRRHRPTPLNLGKRTGDGFEDSFSPMVAQGSAAGSSRRLNFGPASSRLNPALHPLASSSNLALAVPRTHLTPAQASPISIVSEAPSQRGFGGLKSKASKMGLKKLFGI